MNNTSKTLATIGAIIAFILIFAFLTYSRGQSGNKTPGILGLILLIGLIAGIRAIWKKSDSNDDENLTHRKD